MSTPQPVILTNPDLMIDGVTLKCLMSHVELVPDVTLIEVKTSCGIKEYPGSIRWALKATLYHSFDPLGTNNTLTTVVERGVPTTFSVLPYSDKPISVTNPLYSGMLIPQSFTPIAGDIGEASELDLEWSIDGWDVTPTVAQITAQTESYTDPIWTLTTSGDWDDTAFPLLHGDFSRITANGIALGVYAFSTVPLVPTIGVWVRNTPNQILMHKANYLGEDHGAVFAAMTAPVDMSWTYAGHIPALREGDRLEPLPAPETVE